MVLEDSADAETAFFPSTLSGLVEFDGYYLESDPCLVCNNPEVPFCVSNTLSRSVLRFSGSVVPVSKDWLLLPRGSSQVAAWHCGFLLTTVATLSRNFICGWRGGYVDQL